ncbi:MAG: HEAT repeat domain-containing protein [Myxococcales bacterium]|nr:HEAT repeat domain-containing protein [Myxococcales bacterium]
MRLCWIAAALALTGCAASPVVEAARAGDLEAFRARLVERLADPEPVLRGEARDTALGLGGREVEHARGEVGRQTLFALRPCAGALDAALRERSTADDEAAAWAAFLRADAGSVAANEHVDRLESSFDGWRAAAARGLGGERSEEARAWRVRLLHDPSGIVRQAAVLSAAAAATESDVDALFDAARLDPNEEVRTLALAGIGGVGGEVAVLRLKDVWEVAEEPDRVRIVAAWATPASRAAGGQVELARHLTRASGRIGVEVARALGGDAAPADAPDVAHIAAAALERSIEDGASAARVRAIEAAPLAWPALRAAVEAARSSPDDVVAVAAHARLAAGPASEAQTEARKRLAEYTKLDGPAGRAAVRALAHAGDAGALAALERQAKSPSGEDRSEAGALYVALGDYRGALGLLGDADARVRGAVVCALLQAP